MAVDSGRCAGAVRGARSAVVAGVRVEGRASGRWTRRRMAACSAWGGGERGHRSSMCAEASHASIRSGSNRMNLPIL